MILDGMQKTHVKFEMSNPEHRIAYAMLAYQNKQHPYLRFILEPPFISVVNMMQARIVETVLADELKALNIDPLTLPKDLYAERQALAAAEKAQSKVVLAAAEKAQSKVVLSAAENEQSKVVIDSATLYADASKGNSLSSHTAELTKGVDEEQG